MARSHDVTLADIGITKIEGELTENEVRKNFTNDEKTAIGEMIEQQLGNRQGQRTDLKQRGQYFPFAKYKNNRNSCWIGWI